MAATAGRGQPPPAGPASARIWRGTAVAAWVATGVLAVVTLLLVRANGVGPVAFFEQFTGALVISSVATVTVGAVIVVRRPGNPIGWWLCSGLLVALTAAVGQYARLGLVEQPGSLPAAEFAAWVNLWLWLPGLLALVVMLPLVFPTGRVPSPRWRLVGWAAGVAVVAGILFRSLSPGADPSLPEVANPYGLQGGDRLLAVLEGLWVATTMLAVVGAMLALLVRYRAARGRERQQLKWMFYAVALVVAVEVGMPLVGVVLGVPIDPTLTAVAEAVAIPWLAVAVGIAILRHQLYDIDLLISRSLVYGLLTLAVVAIYVLVVGYFGAALDLRGEPVSLLAAAVIAVVFAPLRTRLQRLVNRVVYGQRDEPYAVLSDLGRRLEASFDPDTVLPTVVESVREALRLPHAEIVLADSGHRVVSGTPVGTPLELPLLFGNHSVGTLRLSPRRPGESFTGADHRLLSDFARQAAVAAHAVALTADLRRARTRLVNAREEERRRLRRDLHDGLGPQLASQALALDAARRLLDTDPAAAEGLLVQVREQTRSAVGDIRRLVYGLRPPVLDDRGLAAALDEELSRFAHDDLDIEVQVPDALPELPAAVDVALYRIGQEAVTNVVRHAGATRCTVTLTVDDRMAELRVADDGHGLPADLVPGVGLTSIRERVAELGGQIDVASGNGTTAVVARLPLTLEG